jgi:hypothetical protein
MSRLLDVQPVPINLHVPHVSMDTTFILSIALLQIASFVPTQFLAAFIVVLKASAVSVFRDMYYLEIHAFILMVPCPMDLAFSLTRKEAQL